ncbi:MAG: hypothetical protein LKJ17_06920 [Oscillospiraceae bacterium]|jgi:hypothetical protein|nr:hypothetical protein [Oscillospiraceae bacterium]
MEPGKKFDAAEFYSLIRAIQTESDFLKQAVMTPEEQQERSNVLTNFDNTIQAQVLSTIDHLASYQLHGWRELIDGGENAEEGADQASGVD